MRLLMITVEDPNALEHYYARGLAASDCELRGIVLDKSGRGNWNLSRRVLKRLAPAHAFPQANAQLTAEAERFKPDVVWIFKGMEIYPATLRKLRARGITLVNYNADHPFQFFSRGSGNRNVRRAIPEYHLHLTYSERIARQLSAHYPGTSLAVVPFGHEVSDTVFARIPSVAEIPRACFLGNPDERRRQNIMRLVQAGIPVDVFGYLWEHSLTPSNLLRLNGPAIGEDVLYTLHRYRLQLNFFRPHNVDSHNMRTFEIPACGGIMLAEDSVEHRAFFANGREAFYFASPGEMITLARRLLAMPKLEADAVRAAARRRCVESCYSYRHRARVAFAAIAAAHIKCRDSAARIAG